MAQNAHIRERLTEIQSTTQSEKEWWEKRKADIQSSFMKELDDEKKPMSTENIPSVRQNKNGSDDDAVLVEAGGPASAPGKGKKKKGKN